jgi:hypothetical protein
VYSKLRNAAHQRGILVGDTVIAAAPRFGMNLAS